jgi:hypothetical protein
MRTIKIISSVLFIGIISFYSCSKGDGDVGQTPEKKSSEKSMLSFKFTTVENPNLADDCAGTISGTNIIIGVPSNTDFTKLIASFTISQLSVIKVGSVVQVNKKTVNNFTNPVNYTIIAEDGSLQHFTVTINKTTPTVAPLLKSAWQTFAYPYNAYFPYDAGSSLSINGHEGNACGPTALAKIFHYMQYPVNGVGSVDFTQNNLHWVCDLTTLNLNYANMPNRLYDTDLEPKYKDVAKLFLACQSVGYYLFIWTGNVNSALVPGLKQYFNLDDGLRVVNRWDYSREEWINLFKNELLNGRPIMVAGRKVTSPAPWEQGSVAGHWFNVDGFNAEGKFHVQINYSNFAEYDDIDNLTGTQGYIAYNSAIIGFKKKQ